MQVKVETPISGILHPITDVPDEVFAQQMLGPGMAILAHRETKVTVVSPAQGRIRTILPHAFILEIDSSYCLMVHLGIDTFRLDPQIFKNLVGLGAEVQAGTPIIEWHMSACEQECLHPWVTVSVLGEPKATLEEVAVRQSEIRAGEPLFMFETADAS